MMIDTMHAMEIYAQAKIERKSISKIWGGAVLTPWPRRGEQRGCRRCSGSRTSKTRHQHLFSPSRTSLHSTRACVSTMFSLAFWQHSWALSEERFQRASSSVLGQSSVWKIRLSRIDLYCPTRHHKFHLSNLLSKFQYIQCQNGEI